MSFPQSALDEVLTLLAGEPVIPGDGDHDRARQLSSLLQSGNEDPLVDSALAMLGFTKSTVQRSLSSILGRTLITVLSSSICSGSQIFLNCLERAATSRYADTRSCFVESTVLEHQKLFGEDHTYYGGALSPISVRKIVENSLSFLKGTELEESLVLELLEVLVKVTSTISTSKSRLVGSCLLYEREVRRMPTSGSSTTVSSFMDPLIQFALEKKEVFYNHFSPPIRLLLWRLQPDLLGQDLSALLQRVAERPLMSLKNELRHVKGWYNVIIAMASGPDIFVEARKTLNGWLLASGAPCIWELKAELGATVRDVLEHPFSWGLSLEVGASLPPLSTFYHEMFQSPIKILTRAPTWPGLRELASLVDKEDSQVMGCLGSFKEEGDPLQEDSREGVQNRNAMNYRQWALRDSLWMLLMDFPAWLQFASLSLFQRPNRSCESYDSRHGVGAAPLSGQQQNTHYEDLAGSSHQEIAARYIAWHFSPQDQKLRDLVVRMLIQMVQNWVCIEDEKCNTEESRKKISTMKRRRLMIENGDNLGAVCEEQKNVGGKNVAECNNMQCGEGNLDAHSSKQVMQAVQHWLLNFLDCCRLLDGYTQGGPCHTAGAGNKHQPKRRLLMGDAVGECTPAMEEYSQPVVNPPYCKMSSFFGTLPLVALSCSPGLQIDAVVHLILHFVMSEYGCSLPKTDGSSAVRTFDVSDGDHGAYAYQEGRKGLACREPSHRTEDFKDLCLAPFCLDFSLHASWATSGIARVCKFLETLDLLETSAFLNGCNGLGWLTGFKEIIANQLIACIRRWSQQVDNTQCLTALDDLQHRASLWASRTGLESQTLKAFDQVLQGLDILIASSLVQDTFVDV